MKKHDKVLGWLFVFSLLIVFIFEVVAKDSPEWFDGADESVSILVNLSLSCAAGCIIYYISSYIPQRELELQREQEQKKIDEIISTRIMKILDSYSRIFICAYSDVNVFETVVTEELCESKFKEATKDVKTSDRAVIGFPKQSSSGEFKEIMTIAEFISKEINDINLEVENIIKLERFVSVDLIKYLSELEQAPIISNWWVLVDHKPIILGGQKYASPVGTTAEYSSYFKGLDVKYKELQQIMFNYRATSSGSTYCNALEAARAVDKST